MTLRVAPRVGSFDVEAVRAVVRDAIRGDEVGVLADEVWRDELRIETAEPLAAPSGKVLAFQVLVPPVHRG